MQPFEVREVQSVLQAWANGSCYFQDFINICVKYGQEIKTVSLSVDSKFITCSLFPKGRSAPITPITATLK